MTRPAAASAEVNAAPLPLSLSVEECEPCVRAASFAPRRERRQWQQSSESRIRTRRVAGQRHLRALAEIRETPLPRSSERVCEKGRGAHRRERERAQRSAWATSSREAPLRSRDYWQRGRRSLRLRTACCTG